MGRHHQPSLPPILQELSGRRAETEGLGLRAERVTDARALHHSKGQRRLIFRPVDDLENHSAPEHFGFEISRVHFPVGRLANAGRAAWVGCTDTFRGPCLSPTMPSPGSRVLAVLPERTQF